MWYLRVLSTRMNQVKEIFKSIIQWCIRIHWCTPVLAKIHRTTLFKSIIGIIYCLTCYQVNCKVRWEIWPGKRKMTEHAILVNSLHSTQCLNTCENWRKGINSKTHQKSIYYVFWVNILCFLHVPRFQKRVKRNTIKNIYQQIKYKKKWDVLKRTFLNFAATLWELPFSVLAAAAAACSWKVI